MAKGKSKKVAFVPEDEDESLDGSMLIDANFFDNDFDQVDFDGTIEDDSDDFEAERYGL